MSETEQPETSPCPFCGGEPMRVQGFHGDHGLTWQICCASCGVRGYPEKVEAAALAAWNRRWYPPSKPVDDWLDKVDAQDPGPC